MMDSICLGRIFLFECCALLKTSHIFHLTCLNKKPINCSYLSLEGEGGQMLSSCSYGKVLNFSIASDKQLHPKHPFRNRVDDQQLSDLSGAHSPDSNTITPTPYIHSVIYTQMERQWEEKEPRMTRS